MTLGNWVSIAAGILVPAAIGLVWYIGSLRIEIAHQRERVERARRISGEWRRHYEQARARVRELHTDSPAGPCPTCYRAEDAAADPDDDGLVDYPCPTIRAFDGQPADGGE